MTTFTRWLAIAEEDRTPETYDSIVDGTFTRPPIRTAKPCPVCNRFDCAKWRPLLPETYAPGTGYYLKVAGKLLADRRIRHRHTSTGTWPEKPTHRDIRIMWMAAVIQLQRRGNGTSTE